MMQLFVFDNEIAELLGMGEDSFRTTVKVLERSGFPQKDPQFGGRRYWPAVKAWLDKRYGIGTQSNPIRIDGEEQWDEKV